MTIFDDTQNQPVLVSLQENSPVVIVVGVQGPAGSVTGGGTGGDVNVAGNLTVAGTASVTELTTVSDLQAGSTTRQSGALVSAVGGGDDIEFGHANTAGYRSTLGAEVGAGNPYLAFNAEAGSTQNTFKTSGIPGAVFLSNLTGGFTFGVAATPTQDNQTLLTTATLNQYGDFTASRDLIATSNVQAAGLSISGSADIASLTASGSVTADTLDVTTNATITDNTTTGTLTVTGNAAVDGTLTTTAPASGDDSSTVPTTAWVTSALSSATIATATPATPLTVTDGTNVFSNVSVIEVSPQGQALLSSLTSTSVLIDAASQTDLTVAEQDLSAVTPPVGTPGSNAASLDYVNAAIAAALSGGTGGTGGGGGTGGSTSIPVNTGFPVLSGTATVGSSITCSTGSWTGGGVTYLAGYNPGAGATHTHNNPDLPGLQDAQAKTGTDPYVAKLFDAGSNYPNFPNVWGGSAQIMATNSGVTSFMPLYVFNNIPLASDIETFLNLLPAGQKAGFIYQSEVENGPALTSATFLSNFATIRANMNTALAALGLSSADYPLGISSYMAYYATASSTAFIPPNADFYGADFYQHIADSAENVGAKKDSRFQHWLSSVQSVAGTNAPIAFTEYGIDWGTSAGYTASAEAARAQLLASDLAYISTFGSNFKFWMYWYQADSSHDYTFPSVQYSETAEEAENVVANWQTINGLSYAFQFQRATASTGPFAIIGTATPVYSVVQQTNLHAYGSGSLGGQTLTLPQGTAAGNTLVLLTGCYNSSGAGSFTTPVTSNLVEYYTSSGTNQILGLFVYPNVPVGITSFTGPGNTTTSTGTSYLDYQVMEISGLGAYPSFDAGTTVVSAATPVTVSGSNPAAGSELDLIFVSLSPGGTSVTTPSGWTQGVPFDPYRYETFWTTGSTSTPTAIVTYVGTLSSEILLAQIEPSIPSTDTYVPTVNDANYYLRCAVTATNAAGSSNPAYSNVEGPITESVTISNMTVVVSGTTAVVSVDCSPDIASVTLTTGSGTGSTVAPAAVPSSNGVASWTVTGLATGSYTYYTVGYTSPAGLGGAQASNTLSDTFSITSSTGSGGIVLPANPTGPAIPSKGWTCVFGDTFSTGAIDTNFWVPNKGTLATANQNHLGDNNNSSNNPVNNSEYFNSSQVQLDSTGCNLVCIYKVSGNYTAGGVPLNYLSGTITSRPAAVTAGYPATGFAWRADKVTMWCFEIVCTLPPVTTPGTGADWNWWTTDNPYWTIEIDFFEIWGWNTSFSSMTPITWIYNTGSMSMNQEKYYSTSGPALPSFMTDGKEHRLTWLFNPSTLHVQPYQDGVAIGSGISYPSSFTNGWMSLIAEAGTRGSDTYTATRTYNIRSVAAYYRTGDSPQYLGGGLAKGTVLG